MNMKSTLMYWDEANSSCQVPGEILGIFEFRPQKKKEQAWLFAL